MAVGAPRPIEWTQVFDKESGLSYWWDPDSNQTTALGAPKPDSHPIGSTSSPLGSLRPFQRLQQQSPPATQTFSGAMIQYATLGFGMTLGMVLVRVLLGG